MLTPRASGEAEGQLARQPIEFRGAGSLLNPRGNAKKTLRFQTQPSDLSFWHGAPAAAAAASSGVLPSAYSRMNQPSKGSLLLRPLCLLLSPWASSPHEAREGGLPQPAARPLIPSFLLLFQCGAVLEESGVVEGLQFAESAGGGMSMASLLLLSAFVGRFVPAGGTGRSFGFGCGETREQALQRGLSNIQSVADRLRLSAQHVASAHRLYLMASQRNFSAGRRGVVVAGACLYAICRRERTPHLLIDFSDVLRKHTRSAACGTGVYVQVFMKLLRVLHVQVPQVDPSLFLDRFAAQLNLGDKTRQVAQTAVRLVQAMTRDWISTGRRPVGLCGAALLVAARYHDIQIDAEEVAGVVRISCPTLSKRLSEFKRTAVAQLPASALADTDLLQLPALPLPPCRLVKRRQQQQQQQLEDAAAAEAAESPSAAAAAETAEAGAAAAAAAAGDAEASSAAAAGEPPSPQSEAGDSSPLRQQRQPLGCSEALCKEFPSSSDILSVAGWMMHAINAAPPAASEGAGRAAAAESAAGAADTAAGAAAAEPQQQSLGGGRSAPLSSPAAATAGAAAEGNERGGEEETETVRTAESDNPLADLLRSVRARADELLPPTEGQASLHPGGGVSGSSRGSSSVPPAAGSAAAAAAAAARTAAPGEAGEEEVDEEDGDMNDESDVEGLQDMLLSQQEREAKALIWDDLTRDVMPEVHRRLREKKQKERERQLNPNKRRRPQAKRNAALAAAASAAESVRLSLEKRAKGLAQRIDEEALEALFAARKIVEL
ncbi:hypothetical protein Efla_003798 [Eimeria flavescens]